MNTVKIGNKEYQFRTYKQKECISFAKVNASYGGLHNMSLQYPLQVNGNNIYSSEHIYQALRFPDYPEIQKKVLEPKSAFTSKLVMKEHISFSRNDWNDVKVPIMKWCLMLKLLQNWENFGQLLLSTGNKNIVEYSKKDDFWGAKHIGYNLIGVNALGRLLMGIREEISSLQETDYILLPPSVENFKLFNKEILEITFINLKKLI